MLVRVPRTVVDSYNMAWQFAAVAVGVLLLAAVAVADEGAPVRFVDGDYTVQSGDRVIFVDKNTIVRLGNASTTKDGTELLIRTDVEDADDPYYKGQPDPVISCDRSNCGLYDRTEVAGTAKLSGDEIVLDCNTDFTVHLVFHAARNSWYML